MVTLRLATEQTVETVSRAPGSDPASRQSFTVHKDGGSREGLKSAHTSIPEHEHVPGLTDFTRSFAFPKQGVGKLAVWGEDEDLVQLGVQHIDLTFATSARLWGETEEDLLVILAADSPQFVHAQGLDTPGGGTPVFKVGYTVDYLTDGAVGQGRLG